MSLEASPLAAAVPGLMRSDPHGPGMTRVRDEGGFRYLDPSGAQLTDAGALDRIRALRIPPAWADVWISPDPLGHIQATGTDSKGRLQYLYHRLWREQRDAQKFGHMLRFADALPGLRTAATDDLRHRGLTRNRVVASVVRLIDLGMFRIGGERYAELDHHYGATTLLKQHVRFTRDGIVFDYTAKWGKQRTIVISDNLVQPTIRALARTDNDLDTLWGYEQDGRWHILHSRDVGNYIAARAGGHFTAKEFRTWNATVLMALALANATPTSTPTGRKRTIAASVREVADWLGDTPAVARSSYIDPRLIARYESDGYLPTIPPAPIALPATPEAEIAVAALLASSADPAPDKPGRPGLSGAMFARVRIQPLEFVRVDGPHHPRRERLLEEAADPPGAVPGRGDLHERGAVSRGDRGRGDQAGAGIGLGQDPAGLGFVHPHPVLAGTSARGHREPGGRAGPHTAGFHPEIRERRRQVTRVVITHVRDIPVDHIGRCIDHPLRGDHDFRHAGLSITAGQVHDVSAEALCAKIHKPHGPPVAQSGGPVRRLAGDPPVGPPVAQPTRARLPVPRSLIFAGRALDMASAWAHDQPVIVRPNRDRRTERHEAIRREILDAAWDAAHETSIAGLTLRDIATRVGMQQPSLYSHFASKQAIYDAMFKQAWQACLDDARNALGGLPAEPRARLTAIAEHYFDFAVADLARHQLMDVNVVPNFQPSPEAYAPAVQVYNLMLDQLRGMGISRDEDADVYTALIGGLVNQQLANDPGGQRWRRLIPRVMSMFADDLGLPSAPGRHHPR